MFKNKYRIDETRRKSQRQWVELMSFDWLNIPGLAGEDADVSSDQSRNLPLPTVSFDFGPSNVIPDNNISNSANVAGLDTYSASGPEVLNGVKQQTKSEYKITPHPHFNAAGGHDQQLHQTASTTINHAGQLSRPSGQIHEDQHQTHEKSLQWQQSHTKPSNENIQHQYQETPEDLKVPLSLSRSQLTREEARTYLRWYTFITLRTHGKLVRLSDVFKFLSNFNITTFLKETISTIFRTCKNALNIGQFFAVLRLISKALVEGVVPSRKMILHKAPVPQPRPILNSDHESEVYEEVEDEDDKKMGGNQEHKVDFDSFASLLLTGKSERKRIRRKIRNRASKNKRVRFSEHLTFQEAPSQSEHRKEQNQDGEDGDDEDENPESGLDFSLPMDQLLKRLARRKDKNTALVSSLPDEKSETEEEKEVLEEMKDSLSHFKQIQTVDLASVAPAQLPSIMVNADSNGRVLLEGHGVPSQPPLQPLKPTSTGSANYLFRQQYHGSNDNGDNGSGGAANNQYSPSSQPQPQSQSQFSNQPVLQPLKPTATGSANYLVRNHLPLENQDNMNKTTNGALFTSPLSNGVEPLRPTATGSGNHLMKQQSHQQFAGQLNLPGNAQFLSPSQSPDVMVSPQTTGHSGLGINMQAPQARIPLQQQISPQVTPQTQQSGFFHNTGQNPSMLSAPNPASSYFQALLSHSPSPNSSNLNLHHLNNNSNALQSPQNNQPLTSQSRASYNNGYQFYSPVPANAQQQQEQHQQHQQHQQPLSQNYAQNMASPNTGIYGGSMQPAQRPQNGDILGDLQSLQQQVNALQNVYGRR